MLILNISECFVFYILVDAIVQQVHAIREGRSSNLRGGWIRRFLILDTCWMLYYKRKTIGGRAPSVREIVEKGLENAKEK